MQDCVCGAWLFIGGIFIIKIVDMLQVVSTSMFVLPACKWITSCNIFVIVAHMHPGIVIPYIQTE
jgi:hypothetical protein